MRKRNLSEFMCIEMLYDYKSGRLDPLRHQAVEEGLQASPRVREELKKLTIGISYCDKLKNVSVSEPLVDLILDQPKPAQKIISKLKWGNFPQPVRWAFEAVVVAVAIALFVTQVPELFKGKAVESTSMLMKKFDIKPPGPEVTEETDVPNDDQKVAEVAKVEPVKEEVKKVVEAPVVPAVPIVASKEIPVLLRPLPVDTTAKVEKVAETNPSSTTSSGAATDGAATQSAETSKPAEPAKPVKKGNAYVYRMTMYVDDVDTVTPEIVSLISGLGGEKAGEVELGWRRKSGSYFHFSIPQANSPALQEGLKKYAHFNIIKSAHPRVMPVGVERYILWVEKKEGSAPQSHDEEEGQGPEGVDEGAPVNSPVQSTEPTSAD